MPSDADQGAGTENPAQSLEDRIGSTLWGDEPVQEVADETAAEDDQAPDQDESDQADNQAETQSQAVDEIEIEVEGWKGKIPAKLKAEIDKGADYTRKAQAVAEEKRLFDAQLRASQEQQAFMQAAGKELDQLKQIDSQLEQYKQVDLSQIDGETLSRMSMTAANLREERAKLQEALQTKRGTFKTQMLSHWDTMAQKAHDAIVLTVPDWDKVAGTVAQYALNEGFPFEIITGHDRSTRERVGPGVVDPTFARTLYKAMQWDKLQASKATNLSKATNAPPVVKPGASNTGSNKVVDQVNFKKALKGAGSETRKAEVIGERLMRSKLFR